jgi:oxygen-independent coproporphyrinogen-3 oxidase
MTVSINSSAVALSLYVHIPYCVKRCGYCDFNTYTPGELRADATSVAAVSEGYIDALVTELDQAVARLGEREITTIFFGGGTPTLLPPEHLGRVLRAIEARFLVSNKCEITTEANPDSVTVESLIQLRAAGFNRISFGVQSIKGHVLKVLDRTHDATRVGQVVTAAKGAGFDSISLDLIYGTPGESVADVEESVNFALSLPINHLSAYALIVEQGTKFGAAVRSGDVVMPNDDETAEKYLLIDARMSEAGFNWYELSNWTRPGFESRHNQVYWVSGDWWGVGAGAHSHIAGERWWNLKHPKSYISALAERKSPAAGSELLSDEDKFTESLMLQIRMRTGIDLSIFRDSQRKILENFRQRELFLDQPWHAGRVVLSLNGRLLADQIVRDVLSD